MLSIKNLKKYYGKKLSDYKWGVALISALAVLAVGLCVLTSGFRNWDAKTWFGNNTVCEHVFEDGKCTECGELEILDCEHSFEEGVCTQCGATEEVAE